MRVKYVHVDPLDVTNPERYGDMSTKGIWKDLVPSLENHGMVNPVILWATNKELRVHYGISRVQAAIYLGMPSIPAVVCDMDNRFPQHPELKTVHEIAARWADPDAILPYLNLSKSKLWMNHHPRVAISDTGDFF